ncbi:MAG: hypothetical protein ACRDQA_22930, partial [Nocardioidaceae bacterium]
MTIYSFAQKKLTDVAQRGRLALSSFIVPTGTLKSLSGLVPDGGGAASINSGTMDVTVTPFRAIVQGTKNLAQGTYPVVMDANQTLTLPNGG